MKRVLEPSPIAEVQNTVGKLIELESNERNGHFHSLIFWMSIAEYLKDARRWCYAKNHELPNLSPSELEKYVDTELNK